MRKSFKSLVAAAAAAVVCSATVQPAQADISSTQAHFAFMANYGILATYDIQGSFLALQTYLDGSGTFGNAYTIFRGEAKLHVSYQDFGDGILRQDAYNIVDARF